VILRNLQRIFLLVAIAFLAWFAWESRSELVALLGEATPTYLGLAVVLWCLTHALAPIASMLIFSAKGRPVNYATAASIHIENLPARYVPGGIWHTVGRVAAFGNLGIDARDLSTFVVMENALAVATAFILGGSTIFAIRGLDSWGLIAALGALIGIVVILALPYLLRTRILKGRVELPFRTYIAVIVFANAYWILAASAFVTYVLAYSSLAVQSSMLESGAAYLFSWAVGYLAVFAPQGIGVFEVVAAELLRGPGSLTSVAALLAGFRLVILAADVLAWGMGRLLRLPHARSESER
jgi:hypothetical protein